MPNPLRSEREAFRFLIVVIAGAIVIVVAASINMWLGVAVAVVVVGGILWWLVKEPVPGGRDAKLTTRTPPGAYRILVVAPPGTASVRVDRRATEVVVVVPALTSTVEALTGAVDDRRDDAERTASALAAQVPNGRGEVGADDPGLAVEDALRMFGADEIVVAGDADFVARVRERTALPVSLSTDGSIR